MASSGPTPSGPCPPDVLKSYGIVHLGCKIPPDCLILTPFTGWQRQPGTGTIGRHLPAGPAWQKGSLSSAGGRWGWGRMMMVRQPGWDVGREESKPRAQASGVASPDNPDRQTDKGKKAQTGLETARQPPAWPKGGSRGAAIPHPAPPGAGTDPSLPGVTQAFAPSPVSRGFSWEAVVKSPPAWPCAMRLVVTPPPPPPPHFLPVPCWLFGDKRGLKGGKKEIKPPRMQHGKRG